MGYKKLVGRMATKRAGSRREICSVPMKWVDPEKARSEGATSLVVHQGCEADCRAGEGNSGVDPRSSRR